MNRPRIVGRLKKKGNGKPRGFVSTGIVFPMRTSLPRPAILVFLLGLWLPVAAGEFQIGSADPLVGDQVSEAIRSAIKSPGVRVNGPDGKSVAEFWGRSTPFSGEPVVEFGVRFETIPEGAFLGIARFPEKGSDFRRQTVPPGLYTMRYGLHPEDGNHMGVAASRDFALLTPIAADPEPSKNFSFDELVAMTLRVGNPHPTVLRVGFPEGEEAPNLWQNDYEHWVLDLEAGGELIGFVVHGHSEE